VAKGDAIFTVEKNKLMTVQTADCVPILLYASDIQAVAAVHAGWRGAASGIIQATVARFIADGAAAASIVAAIGPCIQQRSYEVGELFYLNLIENAAGNKQFFLRHGGAIFFDLPNYCSSQMRSIGLTQIDDLGLDTYSNPENFFSFRRYTHECATAGKERLLGHFGCQLSGIALPS
jgi:YfiH family protein